MAILAIKGHATRGEEVMEMLKMLGGRNPHNYSAVCGSLCFYIGKENNIIYYDWVDCCEDEDILVFTLEEFLEKYPYKVGDKVYNIVHNENQTITNLVWDFQENEVVYKTNNNEYVYVNYLQPYKEETMRNKPNLLQQLKEYFENTPQEVIETEWHEYAKYNEIGPSVEEYLEYVNNIRQPKYPKTYDECCKVLSLGEDGRLFTKGYKASIIQDFQKLLICRDSYWKIAGDWKPDWNDNSKFKYVITCKSCNIIMYSYCTLNCILAFPTAEMRDAFYGDFKELIEECKELL